MNVIINIKVLTLLKEKTRRNLSKKERLSMTAIYDGLMLFLASLWAKIESLDLMSNTVIVFVSDQGDGLQDHFTEDDRIPRISNPIPSAANKIEHGHSVYDEVIRFFICLDFSQKGTSMRIRSDLLM